MKLPRPAQAFDSQDEMDDYWLDLAEQEEAEAQAADDAWSEREDETN